MSTEPERVDMPEDFLLLLMERADDPTEIKLALEIARLSAIRHAPLVPVTALSGRARLIVGSGNPRPLDERLGEVLDRAVADGVVLRVVVRDGADARTWVGPATAVARDAVDSVRAGVPEAESALGLTGTASVAIDRPNVFALYERLIGPLTPLIAEELRDAERSYPTRWIEDAMASAVDYNKRNWRYVQAILRGWEEAGAPHAIPRRHP